MQPRIAIIGASGYTGLELTRLLAGHPGVALAVAWCDRWVGESVAARAGVASELRYVSLEDALAQAATCQVALLATPAEASHDLVRKLRGVAHVIDLSGAFRLRDAATHASSYGFERSFGEAGVYGLPELFRARIPNARLVSNPGCYATAIQLALAPILGLVAPGRLIVDAMSGVTGAGRKASEEYSFAEIAGDVRAYRVLRHQHTPEITQGLSELAARDVAVTFVPHLLPVNRGILATCHAQLAPGHSAADVAAAFEARYGAEPFISLAPSADKVSLHDVVGTNRCRIGWAAGNDGELVVTSAIDNLVKGAAGQAVQNLNLLLGLSEQAGLAGLRSFHP